MECTSLDEVRSNIDRIDRQIINLIAERTTYVQQASRFKKDTQDVKAPQRVEAVIEKVRNLAAEFGANADLVETLYRQMIAGFIQQEMDEFKKSQEFQPVDAYIQSFPEPVRNKLSEIREAIRKLVPQAQEKISYKMPAFFLNGPLVYYAAFSEHIGFYPTASGIEVFKNELSGYKHAKGSVQFPMKEPLPMELIERIVRFRVEENLSKKK